MKCWVKKQITIIKEIKKNKVKIGMKKKNKLKTKNPNK